MMKFLMGIIGLLCCTCVAGWAQADTTGLRRPAMPGTGVLPAGSYRSIGKAITGKAAAYSARADGSKTANGEIFDNNQFTAACNKFKFNSWLKITNTKNQETVFVRVNDRNSRKKTAPLVELSRAAVAVLGFLKTETASVKVEQIFINDSFLVSSWLVDQKILQDKNGEINTKPDTFVIGKPVTGIASFYSTNLDGTKTSTGERYRNAKLTAASNHFKLNSWVRVTNLNNQHTVVVRINDRMHPRMKKKGRVVDLSREAARRLDFIERGLVKVKVEQLLFKNPLTDTSATPAADSTLPVQDTAMNRSADSLLLQRGVVTEDSSRKVHTSSSGLAGVYGAGSEGTKTASGEVYRNTKFSAACNLFALGDRIKITNLSNHKSAVVRINDRIDTARQQKGRIVYASRAAAKKLGFINKGFTKVKIELLEKE